MKLRYNLLVLLGVLFGSVFAQTDPQTVSQVYGRDHVKFVSQPLLNGQAGVEYSYTARAVSSDTTAKIYYYPAPLEISSIQPASIDSVIGVLTFTPKVKGWYHLAVIARSTIGGFAIQRFTITVTGGNGIMQGRVTDTSGVVGIHNTIIEVLQALNTDTTSLGCYAYFAKTDKNGYYRISNIDPGSYKIRAVSPTPQYLSQWYDGVSDPKDAKIITIEDSSKVAASNIDFKLRGGATILPKVVASGIVTDANLIPIKPTTNIFFVRYGFALNSKDIDDDYREYFNLNTWWGDFKLDGRSQHVYHVKGDSLGKYSISLPVGTYIAFAKAPGYAKEFYLEKSDLLSANLIVLKHDSTGINFTLAPMPSVALGTINGNVLDSLLDKGIPSRIIAYRDRWISKDNYNCFRSYVVDTDSLGAYMIDSLLPGSYYVLALPLGNYAPAFYSSDSLSTRWKRASRIDVSGDTRNDINIYVRQIPSITNGYSRISGKIHSTSASASLAGALVYAYRNGAVSGYAVTNDEGKYAIEGLAPGSYTVMVDKLGLSETATRYATVSYSNEGNPVGATINFSIDETTEVTQTSIPQPKQFMLEQNFPNPFNPSTTINYTLSQSGIVTLKVYNILGQEIYTLVNGFQNAGSYHTTFNAQGLSSGIYFYRLKSQSTCSNSKNDSSAINNQTISYGPGKGLFQIEITPFYF